MLYVKTEFVGGEQAALDSVVGSDIFADDAAIVMRTDKVCFYRPEFDCYLEADSHNVIKPSYNGTGVRWLLVSELSDVVYNNVLTGTAISYDPPDPPAGGGGYVIWQSDGTGLGDDGDIMIKITNTDGVVKVYTLVDFSEI